MTDESMQRLREVMDAHFTKMAIQENTNNTREEKEQVWQEAYDAVLKEVAAEIERAEAEAREDQIMQDFLSLTVDYGGDIDEVHLIGWRDDQLAELQSKTGEKGME
jgi:hypothetical protein